MNGRNGQAQDVFFWVVGLGRRDHEQNTHGAGAHLYSLPHYISSCGNRVWFGRCLHVGASRVGQRSARQNPRLLCNHVGRSPPLTPSCPAIFYISSWCVSPTCLRLCIVWDVVMAAVSCSVRFGSVRSAYAWLVDRLAVACLSVWLPSAVGPGWILSFLFGCLSGCYSSCWFYLSG